MAENEEKKEKTLGEKVYTWAKVAALMVPLIGASVVSVKAWYKGDDAQDDVASLIKQLNKRVEKQEKVINVQSEKLEKMARRMIYFQGHQEGFSAGKLYVKVEATESKLTQCVAQQVQRARVKPKDLEDLIDAAVGSKKPRAKPSPAPPQADRVQSIPRLNSSPFQKSK